MEKGHRLFFPKGNGLINGWTLLEEALQVMGTKENRGEKRKPAKTTLLGKAEIYKGVQTKDQSFAEITTSGRKNQDTIWLDISECIPKGDLGLLKHGVVGSWKSQPATNPLLTEVEAWAKRAWRLKGSMLFYPLNQNLFFMGFDSLEEANWVMENGSRIFRGEVLHLEWWTPSTGCRGRKGQDLEAWIRVVGLPLHLWIGEILKKVGDSCGGFVALDKETALRTDLLWARILVKMNSKGKPSSVNLLAGARSYELQIWWEIQPRVAEVYPRSNRVTRVLAEPREEDERKTRAVGRVIAERGETSHTFREEQRF